MEEGEFSSAEQPCNTCNADTLQPAEVLSEGCSTSLNATLVNTKSPDPVDNDSDADVQNQASQKTPTDSNFEMCPQSVEEQSRTNECTYANITVTQLADKTLDAEINRTLGAQENVHESPSKTQRASAFEEVNTATGDDSCSNGNHGIAISISDGSIPSEDSTLVNCTRQCLPESANTTDDVQSRSSSSSSSSSHHPLAANNVIHKLPDVRISDSQNVSTRIEQTDSSVGTAKMNSDVSPTCVLAEAGSSLQPVSLSSEQTSMYGSQNSKVLTIAEDRLSLLSFESDCASSSEPIESGLLDSSRCTSSDDEIDDLWATSSNRSMGEQLTPRRENYRDLLASNKVLQQSLAVLSQKVTQQEKQLANQEAEFQEAMARVRAQAKAHADKLRAQFESANKDKEAMVVRYAQSEREVINGRKAKEVTDKKMRDLLQERDSLLGKVKVLHADRVRACSSLDAKMAELAHTQREAERCKEELGHRDIKIKWAQNKQKEEAEAHKDTQFKLEQTVQRLRETREESEQVRKDCQDMIRRYQEAEEIKSVSLDHQLKIKLSELEVEKQERSDQEELYFTMRRELDAFKKKEKFSLEENNALTVKIQALERERLEHEQTVSRLKETLNRLRQEVVDLHGKLTEMESVGMQLDREREKVSASQREVERIRAAHQELQSDLEASHAKEGELLEFTQRMTAKTVHLQSEHSLLEVKAQNLDEETSRLSSQCADLENANQKLLKDLEEESQLRQEETQLLARKLAEKTKAVESLGLKLMESENENRVLKRRHITSIKELSRELSHAKKRFEQLEASVSGQPAPTNNHHSGLGGGGSTPGESRSLQGSSRTSSSGSLVETNSGGHPVVNSGGAHQSHPTNSHLPPPAVTFSNRRASKLKAESPAHKPRTKVRDGPVTGPVAQTPAPQTGGQGGAPEISQQLLIDRIVRLQRTLARRNEKVEFLEEHIQQLLADIKKKSRVIQNYILREETGALAPGSMDQNKAEVLRRGGIMASVYGSHAADSSMTLDLSLEINHKLQAVLEDTILKNITLKENINTLGDEIARISREQSRRP